MSDLSDLRPPGGWGNYRPRPAEPEPPPPAPPRATRPRHPERLTFATDAQAAPARELPAGEEWRASAACLGIEDADAIFFPQPGRVGAARKDEAKAICARCPVTEPCLDYALRNNPEYGIWGGTTPKERRRIARSRRAS